MIKREFEDKLGATVSQEEYELIEKVYMYYPGINNKAEIASLFKIGGLILINDMLPRAEKIADLESRMSSLNTELNKLKGTE